MTWMSGQCGVWIQRPCEAESSAAYAYAVTQPAVLTAQQEKSGFACLQHWPIALRVTRCVNVHEHMFQAAVPPANTRHKSVQCFEIVDRSIRWPLEGLPSVSWCKAATAACATVHMCLPVVRQGLGDPGVGPSHICAVRPLLHLYICCS